MQGWLLSAGNALSLLHILYLNFESIFFFKTEMFTQGYIYETTDTCLAQDF